jgi:hypothetical protein
VLPAVRSSVDTCTRCLHCLSCAARAIPSLAAFPAADPSNEVAAAIAAIDGGKITKLHGGNLHMEGAIWPCATNSELLVRACYEPLFSDILGKLRPAAINSKPAKRERRFIVAGQPGIGKSVLIWYIIFRLRTEQPERAIIYVDNEEDCYIIVPGEPVRVCSLSELVMLRFSSELAALNPVFLCDSVIPPTPPCPCVVVSSPGRLARLAASDSEVFKQHYMPWLYVPVPTDAEVLRLREVAFQHEPEALVRQRMELWGPNPRFVLVRTSMSEQSEAWKKAREASLDDLLKAAKAQFFGAPVGDKGDAPHRLVMERCLGQDAADGSPESDMRNPAYWMRGAVVFPSSPVARYVVNRMLAEKRWTAAFLVDATARIGSLGVLRGLHFEQIALQVLVEGGSFQVRRLLPPSTGRRKRVALAAPAVGSVDGLDSDSRAVAQDANGLRSGDASSFHDDADDGLVAGHDGGHPRLVLDPTDKRIWADTDRLAQLKDEEAALVPAQGNAAGLDGFVWVPSLNHHVPVDATISKKHGLHQSGLFAALTALGWSPTNGWPQRPLSKKHPNLKKRRRLQVPYYWAVPDSEFDESWVVEQQAKDGTGQPQMAERLVQFAVCIPSRLTLKVVGHALASVPTPEVCLARLAVALGASKSA